MAVAREDRSHKCSPSVLDLAAEEMEHPTQLSIRVTSTGLELDPRGGLELIGVGGIERRPGELEPVHEEPHPVPIQGLDPLASHQRAEIIDGVGATRDTEDARLDARVEGGERVVPSPLHRRTHRRRGGVGGHDRDDASVARAATELRDQRLGARQITEHAVAEDGVVTAAVDDLRCRLTVALKEGDASSGLEW